MLVMGCPLLELRRKFAPARVLPHNAFIRTIDALNALMKESRA
jgi:hypothetical protein